MRLRYVFFLLFLFPVIKGYSQSAKIFIKQDSLVKEVLYDSSVIVLKKKPFSIEVQLINLDGLFASVSYDSFYYSTPTRVNFKDWKYIGSKVMAENSFNSEKRLIIEDELLHYWFYDSTLDWHRFDKGLIADGDTIIGTKTITNFMDKDNNKAILPVETMHKPLFLVFFSTDSKNKTKTPIELFRKKVVLQFE